MASMVLTKPRSDGTSVPQIATVPQPVSEEQRIVSIDVLRGFALLGILPMNIQYFSMISAAYQNPTAYGNLTGANYRVWLLCHVLADEKFMTIFSMLFGAGILLMTSRIEAVGKPSALLHYRRMGWLILFGLAHAYLLWSGDILVAYGMCGLLVYLCRRLRPRTLLVLGLLTIAVASASLTSYGAWSQHWSPAQVEVAREQLWMPTTSQVAKEIAAYRGDWTVQMKFRVPDSVQMETIFFVAFTFWRVTGLMLAGMALFKLGIFGAKRPASLYGMMIAVAVCIGIPVTLYGTHRDFSAGWDKKTPTQQAIANAGQSAANAVSGAWSGIKNAASGMMKSGTANIHKSEVGHFVSAEEIYTKCQHCGQPEFVATPNGPRFNPCACFMAMTKDEDGNPTHFVALRKTADGYQVSFDPSVDEDAAKVFLLTLKTRLLVKKKFGV